MRKLLLPAAWASSCPALDGRVALLPHRRRALFNPAELTVALVVLLLLFTACGTGTVTTSTGQIVPAGVVVAQDTTADILQSLDTAYKAAVAAHDAAVGTEDPVIHAKHRKVLLDVYAGLRGSWDALIAWKAASNDPAPPNMLSSVATAARDFVPLAEQLGVLNQAKGDSILKYLNAFVPGGAP